MLFLELIYDHFLLRFEVYQDQIILKIFDRQVMIKEHLKIYVSILQIGLLLKIGLYFPF